MLSYSSIRDCSAIGLIILLLFFSLSTSHAGELPARLNAVDLELDSSHLLSAEGCNRALHFRVTGIELQDRYAGHAPPPGQHWLVIDARVENRMPADLLFDLDYREEILIASLQRQFYLLINGKLVTRRVLFDDDESAMDDGFVLGQIGQSKSGRLVYPVPAEGVESLSLRYYHDEFAPAVVVLMGQDDGDAASMPASSGSVKSNDLMTIGMMGASFQPDWHGQAAPDGMEWLVVDLRGQGTWVIEADALALNRAAEPAEKINLPKVMEYVQAQGLLTAVADGQYGYPRDLPLSLIPDEPAFLPDAFAGGRAVFPVPTGAESIQLEVHFPEFRGPGIATPIPDSMTFVLRGDPSEVMKADELAGIDDEPTPFTLHALNQLDQFHHHIAGPGQTLIVLDASMRNTSPVGGMMAISSRIDLLTADGSKLELLGAYSRGSAPLAEPFWLPAGGASRRFNLVYRAQADSLPEELAYRGVSINTTVPLP